jgi:uncharacterized protein (DUF924 family)
MDKYEILNYWFDAAQDNGAKGPTDAEINQRQSALWWQKNRAVDRDIHQRFEPTLKALLRGQYHDWLQQADGRLAAIIVLDQFSRNMYRNSALSFTQDSLALHWCLEGIRSGQDKQLSPIQRVFFYMPLEHAESPQMQALCLEKFQQLKADAPASFQAAAEGFIGFAQRHKDIIDRFGHFPHRNALLGRSSSAEELAFLQQPGSSF